MGDLSDERVAEMVDGGPASHAEWSNVLAEIQRRRKRDAGDLAARALCRSVCPDGKWVRCDDLLTPKRVSEYAAALAAEREAERPGLRDAAAQAEMDRLMTVVRAVRNLRSEYDVRPSQPVEAQVYAADEATRARLGDAASLIATLARIEPFTVLARPERPSGAAVEMLDGVELYVPLAGLVEDLAAEQRRLERELDKVAKELRGVETKLNNPQFMERAPDDIVADVRGKSAALGERRQALERSLGRLRSLEA